MKNRPLHFIQKIEDI